MKINHRLLVFALFSLIIRLASAQGGQELSIQQKKAAGATLTNLLNDYIKSCSLQKPGMQGVSEEQITSFLSLFEANAIVWDDLTPLNYSNKQLNTGESTVEKMVADYKLHFPGGISNKTEKANINYTNLAKHTAQIVVQRTISGNYEGKSYLANPGSIMELEVKLADDCSSAKITEIKKISSNPIPCPNCPKPYNVSTPIVIVDTDKTPVKSPGDKLMDGKKQGVVLAFNLAGGFNTANFASPVFTSQNFSEPTVSRVVNFSSKGKSALGLGLDADLMFLKDKTFGLSIGVYFQHSGATIQFDTLHLEYTAVNNNFDKQQSFTRIYDAHDVTEVISMNNVALNLLFKYDGGRKHKGLYVQAGPAFVLSGNATSNYSSTTGADYGAAYKNSLITRKAYYDSHPNATEADITSYFAERAAFFDVGYKTPVNGTSEKIMFKGGIGAIARVGASIPLSPKMNVLAGAQIMYMKMSGNAQLNNPLTDNVGQYYTTLYGIKSIDNVSYSLHIGITYAIY